MKKTITLLSGFLGLLQTLLAEGLPMGGLQYIPPGGYGSFGLRNDPGDSPFSLAGPGREYLSNDQRSSVKFQLTFACLPVGKPMPSDLRHSIEVALGKRLGESSAFVTGRTTIHIREQSELPTARLGGVVKMKPDAPFDTALVELRWIHIQSNVVLTIMAMSPNTNAFTSLTNSLESLKLDKGKLLESIPSALLAPFAPLDVEFEGRRVGVWLYELIGVSEAGSRRLDETVQEKAIEAIRRMGSREFAYMVELLPSAKTDRLLFEAIVHAFKAAPTNGISAIPTLIELFALDEVTARNAKRCLRYIGTPSIPPLVQSLSDKDVQVRQYACHTLAEIGPPAKDAIPILSKLAADPDEPVRMNAAFALEQIGYKAPTAK